MSLPTKLDSDRCCEMVRDDGRWPSFHQCRRKHVVECEGKHYCAIHDPQKVQEKTKALHAKWEREWAEKARVNRLSSAAPALLAAAKRCLPDWEIEPDQQDHQICCELTVGDVRALRAAIAAAEGAE